MESEPKNLPMIAPSTNIHAVTANTINICAEVIFLNVFYHKYIPKICTYYSAKKSLTFIFIPHFL